jgi:hypothetical protein
LVFGDSDIGYYLIIVIWLLGISLSLSTDSLDRLNDLKIPCATAEVSCNGGPDLFVSGFWILIEQGPGRQDHPRRAEAALNRPVLNKRSLEGVEVSIHISQSLNGGDAHSLRLHDRKDAGIDGLSIDENGAGAAFPHATAFLCSGELKLISENLQERQAGFNLDLYRLAIQFKMDGLFHHLILSVTVEVTLTLTE